MLKLKGKSFFAAILLSAIALSFLLYGNSIKGKFLYDDKFFSERSDLRQAEGLINVWSRPFLPQHKDAGMYRPLAVFSFALNFILFGESTVSFHVVNIILHGLTASLLFLVIFKIFDRSLLAIFSALLFLFMPIHSEAVAFIKSRDEILAAVFVLLAWLVFISGTRTRSYKKIFFSSVLLLLAVFSKETSILAPVLFLAVYLIKEKPSWVRLVKTAIIYAPVYAFYLIVRFAVLGSYAFGKDDSYFIINPLGAADYLTRFWTACKIVFIYISKTFFPYNLSATYHYNQLTLINNPLTSIETIIGFLILAAFIFLTINKKTRSSPVGIGILTFLTLYLVISKFIFSAGDTLGERWIYLPSAGLALVGGGALEKIYKLRKKITLTVFVLILAAYSFILIPRNRVWLDGRSLYESMVRDAPKSAQAHTNLAKWYLDSGKIEEARREAEIAFNIYKDHPPLLNIIGIIAYKDGNYDLAERAFLRAIELRPKLPTSFSNIGLLYYQTGEYVKAEEALRNIVKLYPKPEDILIYSLTLSKLKRYPESLETVNKYFSSDPDNNQVRFILALNYYRLGNLNEAKKYFDWNPNKSESEKIKILGEF